MIDAARGESRSIRAADELRARGRQLHLVERAPLPARASIPDPAIIHERAQHLRDEQRIALGVAVQERRQLDADVALMKDGLEPAFELVAR